MSVETAHHASSFARLAKARADVQARKQDHAASTAEARIRFARKDISGFVSKYSRHQCTQFTCEPMNEDACIRAGLYPAGAMPIDSSVYVCNRGIAHRCTIFHCNYLGVCPVSGIERSAHIAEEEDEGAASTEKGATIKAAAVRIQKKKPLADSESFLVTCDASGKRSGFCRVRARASDDAGTKPQEHRVTLRRSLVHLQPKATGLIRDTVHALLFDANIRNEVNATAIKDYVAAYRARWTLELAAFKAGKRWPNLSTLRAITKHHTILPHTYQTQVASPSLEATYVRRATKAWAIACKIGWVATYHKTVSPALFAAALLYSMRRGSPIDPVLDLRIIPVDTYLLVNLPRPRDLRLFTTTVTKDAAKREITSSVLEWCRSADVLFELRDCLIAYVFWRLYVFDGAFKHVPF